MKPIIIGTRGSALALWQANHIKQRLSDELNLESTLQIVKTRGDKILDVPLAKIGGKGLFTKELEELLLTREIDIAVHSLKDVPVEFPAGLTLACITKREDARDCLVSHRYANISDLPPNAKVGTTSLRRAMQLKILRDDLQALNLRGNVQTRLSKLDSGEFGAIMLANAGLKRLGISQAQIAHICPLDVREMIPAMGQAALGIECREDSELLPLLNKLNHAPTSICAQAEREFVRALEGGCQVPIGVHCSFVDDAGLAESSLSPALDSSADSSALSNLEVNISAIVGLPDGSRFLKDSSNTNAADALTCANTLAQSFIAQGAKDILAQAVKFWE